MWASMREGMKAETLEHRSSDPGNLGEYSKARLLGFARRDKVIKHIKKAHKVIFLLLFQFSLADCQQDIDTTAEDFAIERDALVGEPIVAEVQAFWARLWSDWRARVFGRLQRSDGSWVRLLLFVSLWRFIFRYSYSGVKCLGAIANISETSKHHIDISHESSSRMQYSILI
jgi:hypothetical protein